MTELWEELLGPKRFNPWVKESPLWWICYRTVHAGHWTKEDIEEFKKSKARYIVYFDHAKNDEACLFCLRVMERDPYFKAVKVSKFARDGEKIIVFLGKGREREQKMADLCKEMGFVLWGVRGKEDVQPLERELSRRYDQYLYCLGMAFREMNPQGDVNVTGLEI